MDFAFTDEQEALRQTARAWLARRFPIERVAELAASPAGWDPACWSELESLGWLDAALSEVELAVLAEEAGYALLPGPWFASVGLGWPALRFAGREPGGPATLAVADAGAGPCRADGADRLTGVKRNVPDAAAVDEVVVAALPDGGGTALYRVDLTAHPSVVTELSTVDATRRLAELRLDAVPAEPLVPSCHATRALDGIRRRALAMLACEAVGVAQRALDFGVEHATSRVQFGQPIGAFQAVSHPLVDAYVAVQTARSLAYRAAWCVATGADEVAEAVALATVAARRAAVESCECAIQVLGGIGFTWEHPLHRLYRRAQWIAAFEGFPAEHRAELAAHLLDPGRALS